MCKVVVYTEERFISLQKRVLIDLKLTPDNVQQKILELPIIYTKYKKLYLEQRRLLKNINNDIKRTRAKRYHYYKFDGDFRLDNATEINIFVDGDDELCEINLILDNQDAIVEFLKETVSNITKMSYLIRSYVDLEKLRNGAIT